MSFVINAISSAHEFYVGTYEVLGAATNFFWERAPRILPERLTQSLRNIGPAIREGTARAVSNIIQRIHRGRGQLFYRAALRQLRPEMERLADDQHRALHSLSRLCSLAFDRPLIFSSTPTLEELEALQERLNELIERRELSAFRRRAAEQGLVACQTFIEILESMEALRNEDISVRDYQALLQKLQSNYLVLNGYWAALENIGEYAGGSIVDEASILLPSVYNPVILFADRFSERFASLGRFSGVFLTLATVCYLIGKLPSLQQNRLGIRALAISVLLGLEYLQSNPISNYAQAAAGQVGYDFAFYSAALLCNYLGMWLTGTSERLADYTRNMTFSMISYRASQTALEAYGAGAITNTLVSLFISHLAYNAGSYRDAAGGRILEQYSFDRERDALRALDERVIHASKRNVASLAIQGTIWKTEQMIIETLTIRLSKLLQLSPQSEKSFVDAIYRKCIRELVAFKLQQQTMNTVELRQTIENISETQWIPREENLQPMAFLARELIDFFHVIETNQMQRFVESYKTALLDLMQNSSMRNPENGQNGALAIIQRIWIRTFISEQYQGPLLNQITLLAEHLFEQQSMDHHLFIQNSIEPFLQYYLHSFFPLIPSTSQQEKICAEHLTQLLMNLFAISLILKMFNRQIDPARLTTPLERGEFIELSRHLTNFVLQWQYPRHLSFSKNMRRSLASYLLRSQLN